MANISRPGADPAIAYESIRKQGVLEENVLPWSDDLKTLEDYAKPKPLPENLLSKARQFMDYFVFKHEYLKRGLDGKVNVETIKEQLKKSPLAVAAQAWSFDGEKYVRTGGDTHWAIIFGFHPDSDFKCFDSYAPYIKRLDKDFGFRWVKKIHLHKKTEEEKRVELSGLLALLKAALDWLALLLPFLKKKEEPIVEPTPEPPIEPPKESKYKWGTKEEARHSVRVICDEEGLNWNEKQLISAVINCESGYDTKAKHENKDSQGKVLSTDWGICQYNDYYYIGPSKPIASVEEALNNPEKCVRVMISQSRKGRLRDWVCYKSEKYVNYSS